MNNLTFVATFDSYVNACVREICDGVIYDSGINVLNTITCKKDVTLKDFEPIRIRMRTLSYFLKKAFRGVFTQDERRSLWYGWGKLSIINDLKCLLKIKSDKRNIDEGIQLFMIITSFIDEYDYFTCKLYHHLYAKRALVKTTI